MQYGDNTFGNSAPVLVDIAARNRVLRNTYLIDRNGKIARIWEKVKVPGHAQEVLDAARELST